MKTFVPKPMTKIAIALLSVCMATPALAAQRLAPLPEIMLGDWCHDEGTRYMWIEAKPFCPAAERVTVTAKSFGDCTFRTLHRTGKLTIPVQGAPPEDYVPAMAGTMTCDGKPVQFNLYFEKFLYMERK
jgi:hypothetical protein